MNTPGGNTISTAQLAISLICALARKIAAADISIKAGKWDRKSFTGIELAGKTLAIVGCGRIGQVVAQTATTLGMKIIGFDPIMTAEQLKEVNIQKATLEEIWAKSDIITIHTPLTKDTANLINDTTIAKCKKGVRIVNCARGGIVDEDALLRGLESGHVAGAALDVFTSEPPKENLRPLLAHPNLVVTPHLGASTEEAQINVARDIANQMCDVFDHKDFLGVVNVSYLLASTQAHMKPFMELAETIGAMHSQLSDGNPISKVTLKTFGGRDANIATKQSRQLLEALVLKGIVKHMKPTNGRDVPDLISAPSMASEANIQSSISEEQPDHMGTYWNLVSVDVERGNGTKTNITGAVIGNIPHIVKVDRYSDLFAFRPEGNYILTFRNEDKPGAISQVLDILHMANVNIASMTVARAATENHALTFISLDDDVSSHAMKSLKAIEFLHDVAKIQVR
jgi:D-3-phosphoglycerate dehydrogenase